MPSLRTSLPAVLAATAALGGGSLEAGMRLTVQPDVWNQLVFPGGIDGESIRDLFTDPTLEPSTYGSEWILFTFDAATQRYIDPGIDGTLVEGEGFWFIQSTGESVTLDSTDMPYALGSPDPACAGLDGCSTAPLAEPGDGIAWSMTGNPFEAPVAAGDARIENAGGAVACAEGCSLEQAADDGIIGPVLWSYDAESGSYAPVFAGSLPVWGGFWVATVAPSATSFTRLLLPDPFCS